MKSRLIVAAVLLPVLIVALLWLPTIVTTILVALIAALASYELLYNTRFVKNIRLVLYAMAMAAFTIVWCHFDMVYTVALLGILLFTIALSAELLISHGKLPFTQLSACFVGGIIIPLLLGSLVRIHNLGYGRFYVLLPFMIAFVADSGAYFAGRFFGRHKLAPIISPNKTIEGVVGGVVATIVGMLLYCLILQFGFAFQVNYLYAVSYGIVGALTAVCGDLVFSAIKRQTGIKDYGTLLPGHGGALDRFDSIVFVAPFTELLLTYLPVVVK